MNWLRANIASFLLPITGQPISLSHGPIIKQLVIEKTFNWLEPP